MDPRKYIEYNLKAFGTRYIKMATGKLLILKNNIKSKVGLNYY